MEALLGILLFSVLLATGASLECETCISETGCSKVPCIAGEDTCMKLVLEVAAGSETVATTVKGCASKAACEKLKPGKTSDITGVSGKIKEVTCKAPSFSASLFLALSGFLLLKILS